jgi:hypothetical protein
MKSKLFCFLGCFLFIIGVKVTNAGEKAVWKDLLTKQSNCVTWLSLTMKIDVSAGGRSLPSQEQKLEALGTVIAKDGLTVLSLTSIDPKSKIMSRLRTSSASVQVNYTEVLILKPDGTEIPAKVLLKDEDLDLAFVLPLDSKSSSFPVFCSISDKSNTLDVLDEVVTMSKLGKNLYRQSTLRKGWVNALISKPRKYLVIENSSPGNPVFDREGDWLGVAVYKMERGQPSSLVTLPAEDILEIAQQVRSRIQ